jgi:hypothetical protein
MFGDRSKFVRGIGLCHLASLKGFYIAILGALSGEGVE